MYTLLHVVRCLSFAAGAVFLADHKTLQLLTLGLPTLLMILLISGHSHQVWRDKIIWVQHLVNELTIYLTCIFLCLFSEEIVRDVSLREKMGLSFLCMLGANIVFNFTVIYLVTVHRIALVCKRAAVQKKQNNDKKVAPLTEQQSMTENALMKANQSVVDTRVFDHSTSQKKPLVQVDEIDEEEEKVQPSIVDQPLVLRSALERSQETVKEPDQSLEIYDNEKIIG